MICKLFLYYHAFSGAFTHLDLRHIVNSISFSFPNPDIAVILSVVICVMNPTIMRIHFLLLGVSFAIPKIDYSSNRENQTLSFRDYNAKSL